MPRHKLEVSPAGCSEDNQQLSFQDFPGAPVVRTLCFHGRGPGSVPGQGTKILHAA